MRFVLRSKSGSRFCGLTVRQRFRGSFSASENNAQLSTELMRKLLGDHLDDWAAPLAALIGAMRANPNGGVLWGDAHGRHCTWEAHG